MAECIFNTTKKRINIILPKNTQTQQSIGKQDNQRRTYDIVNYIKSQRIKWLGHVMRKDKTKTIRIVTEWKPTENRKRGKPKIRWIDDVVEDLKTLEIKNWKVKCHNRTEWSKIAEEAD
ncbi:hypothetical protein RN001_016205 [Aquatica leii]|uniref:Uncharacterized protein n=1 Tax=Aquatica leii TaxID=1421715 RepID=A0AAN7NZ30_9COLE|nr:hypothetical protein RN001_016205 [Aquatica leii]